MVKSIESIFSEVKKKYPGLKLQLASGGLSDVKGPGTSDVDIVYLVPPTVDYCALDAIFKDTIKEPKPEKNRCYYKFKKSGREVAICASSDKAVLRSVVHRKNELMLNSFPHITAAAINLKINGAKTEHAWAEVLQLSGDPYDAMTMETAKLKKIAKSREEKIKKIYKGLSLK